MSFFQPKIHGFKSGADLSGHENRFVKPDSTVANGEQVVKSGAGDRAVGIQMNVPNSTGPVEVSILGGAKLVLGGTVSLGNRLKSDANGKGVVIAGAGDEVVAVAEADGVLDDIIPVTSLGHYGHPSHDGTP